MNELRILARAMGISYNKLTKDMKGISYKNVSGSYARAALLRLKEREKELKELFRHFQEKAFKKFLKITDKGRF